MSSEKDKKAEKILNATSATIIEPQAGVDNPATSFVGVTVKVENLDVARVFYRDTLELGAPVMDSTFWVEFKVGDKASLFLEQAHPEEKLVPTRGRVAWICETSNLEGIVAKLKELGHDPVAVATEKAGYQVLRFQDPEGNPFYLRPAQ